MGTSDQELLWEIFVQQVSERGRCFEINGIQHLLFGSFELVVENNSG